MERDCNAPPTRNLNIWLCGRQTDLSVVGVKVGLVNLFSGQSIGIDENNTFQLNFYSSNKTVGVTVLGGLWALEWAWHTDETKLRCAGISRICMPNPSIAALIRTEGQTDRRTWLDQLG